MDTAKKKDWAVWVILGTFPLITMPLFIWNYFGWNQPILNFILRDFFFAFGLSHLFITLFIYLSSENRAYFSEGKKNTLIFIFIPAFIFIYTGLMSTLSRYKVDGIANILLVTAWIVHSANINHNTRQTYGVVQLMKVRSGFISSKAGPFWENIFLGSLTVLQLETVFIGSRRFPTHSLLAWVTVAVCFLLFLNVFRIYFHEAREQRKSSLLPFSYLACQAFAFGAAAYDMRFFIAASAVHYVEYHILMVSRFSGFQGNQSKWTDRTLTWISKNPVVFFGVPIIIGTLFGFFVLGKAIMSLPIEYNFFFGMLNGIFLFHYFLEGFIWRLRVPFFRRTVKLPHSFSKESAIAPN